MKFKAVLICLILSILVGSAFAQVLVKVDTDKSIYSPGDDIIVSVYLSPYNVRVSQSLYDVNLYVKSDDNGKFVSFNSASCPQPVLFSFRDPKLSPTWECSKAGSYISTDGTYYGMWVFGTLGTAPQILTKEEKLASFTLKAKSLTLTQAQVLGVTGNKVDVSISPLVREINDYSGTTKVQVASSTSPVHLSKVITIAFSCANNAECGAGNFCVANACEDGAVGSNCLSSAQCDSGNFCVNRVCQDGNLGSSCSDDPTCDQVLDGGYFCVNFLCTSGNEGSACIDNADCLSSTLSCTNGICSKPVDPVCVGAANPNDCDGDGVINAQDKCLNSIANHEVFTAGPFMGCMKGDINLDQLINSGDITKFIEYYVDRSNYNPATPWPADLNGESGNGDNVITSSDITKFVEFYNKR